MAAVSGSDRSGSSRARAHAKKAAYRATIRNSPWAKLTISMRPKMSDSPAAMRAYTKPIRTPPTTAWASRSKVSGGAPERLLAVLPRRDRVDHVPRGHVEGPHRVVLAGLELHDDGLHERVLPVLVELDALPRHDELVAGNAGGHQRLLDGLGGQGACAVEGIEERDHAGEGAGGEVVEVLAVPLRVDRVEGLGHRALVDEVGRERRS